MSIHRRRFLRLCSVAGFGVIAGCSSESENTSTPTGDQATATPTNNQSTATPKESTSTAQTITQQAKLAANDGDETDQFGWSVALSSDGTTALIGAYLDEDPNGRRAGSAYIYDGAGGSWSQQAKLAPDDGDNRDFFGRSVAVSSDGTTALVGAYGDEDPNGSEAGSAYVFENRSGSWSQQTKLTASDGDSNDNFGFSVDLSSNGTIALIGAPDDNDPNGEEAGSMYVFTDSGQSWSQQAKLVPSDGDNTDRFGWDVALSGSGTTALGGAYQDQDPNGEKAGSVYAFNTSGGSWSQQAKIAPNDADSDDEFGWSVAVSGDGTTALIGARRDEDPNGYRAGSAYVFDSAGGSWSQQAKFAPRDGDSNDEFGQSVALSSDGTTALVGAWAADNPNGEDAGSVYVFDSASGSWEQRAKLTADDGDSNDDFGQSVAVSSDGATGLVGARSDEDPNGSGAGSAYAFDL